EQQLGDARPNEADDNVKDEPWLAIGSHDQARKPAANTANDQPDDDCHEFPSCSRPPCLRAAAFPASQTRDARQLFRIRKGLSSFPANEAALRRRASWINAGQ